MEKNKTIKILGIIPARSGSKRLPGKNIRLFLEKPIISYTIKAAKQSRCFQRLLVSTNCKKTAAISRKCQADVRMRPSALALDSASVADVCKFILEQDDIRQEQFDMVCVLYATSPLRGPKDIRSVVNLVKYKGHSSAMAVTTFGYPINQALSKHRKKILPVFPKIFKKNAKDLPKYFVDNGSTYAVRTDYFLSRHSFFSPDLAVHVMPRIRSVDIDTWEDFFTAETTARALKKHP